jgi:hypothetical protein
MAGKNFTIDIIHNKNRGLYEFLAPGGRFKCEGICAVMAVKAGAHLYNLSKNFHFFRDSPKKELEAMEWSLHFNSHVKG